MAEDIGTIFPTQVPSYTEAADIRKAFNLYHYGSQDVPTDISQVPANSIAGHLNYITGRISGLEAGAAEIIQLQTNQSLNNITTSGIYHSVETPTLPFNYPTTVSGLLSVYRHEIALSIFIYQTYQTSGITNNYFWRVGNLSGATPSWSLWSQASKDGHTHLNYVESDTFNNTINSKITTVLTSSRAAIVDSTGKLTSSSNITELELSRLDGILTNITIQDQLNDKASLSHSHDDLYHAKTGAGRQPKIFVQSDTPSGAQIGDLWFF